MQFVNFAPELDRHAGNLIGGKVPNPPVAQFNGRLRQFETVLQSGLVNRVLVRATDKTPVGLVRAEIDPGDHRVRAARNLRPFQDVLPFRRRQTVGGQVLHGHDFLGQIDDLKRVQ